MKSLHLLTIFAIAALWTPLCLADASVNVTGEAEILVKPDEVVLTLGVETINKQLRTAKKANDDSVKAVLKLAKSIGIEDRHIQTDHISIQPDYDYNGGRKKLIGYFVRKTIVITLKDLKKFEGLITQALDSGANYVHGVQFRTTELRKHRDKARDLALKAAKEKAVALAGTLGKKIGDPTQISEGGNWWGSNYSSWWHGGGSAMTQNVVQQVGDSGFTGETVSVGQISVKAKISAVFELL